MMNALLQRAMAASEDRYKQLAPGLSLFRRHEPTRFDAMVYEPLVCLILQGQKHTIAGEQTAVVHAGECIVVSHATPVVARVTEASTERPYLSLIAPLDLTELRSLDAEMEGPLGTEPASSFAVAAVDDPTLDVLTRYVALADNAEEARILAPLLRRELHFRLLRSDAGAMLRQLLRRDSHASHVARAIELLRDDYRRRVEMDELARQVGMSTSSFYKHFKAVTSTTPLQFQKDLRLTEARRLLFGGEHSVSTAAFAVGYESPSQFSREYSRKFGAPPRADLAV